MNIDGKEVAQQVIASVKEELQDARPPRLVVFVCAPDFATQKFLGIKQERAKELGVLVEVVNLPSDSTTEDTASRITEYLPRTDGIIVQLPFPKHIDIDTVLASIPESHDVDAIGKEAVAALTENTQKVLSPVVASIALLAEKYQVTVRGKKVVVIGEGRLVGAPSAIWFRNQGADVVTINKETDDIASYTRNADIVVLGAGVPGLLTPEMIKDGVVVYDAGTSEEGGKLVGDAESACAEKASLFTPVPGGIGPITVAMIFRNLLILRQSGQQ